MIKQIIYLTFISLLTLLLFEGCTKTEETKPAFERPAPQQHEEKVPGKRPTKEQKWSSYSITISAPRTVAVGTAATFSGNVGSSVARVVVSVDGYQIADVTPTNGAYAFSYTFNYASSNRYVLARAFNSAGTQIASNFTTMDVTSNTPVAYIPNFPYYYQYYNSYNPGGSCQNTCMAMVLNYYGANVTPDNISNYYGTSAAQTVSGWNSQFNADAAYFGLNYRANSTAYGSVTQLRSELQAGRPVVVHGYFTSYGHVIVLTGYDGTFYYANDPAGSWCESFGDGSCYGYSSTVGKEIRYSKSALEAAVSPDGYVWMHSFYRL